MKILIKDFSLGHRNRSVGISLQKYQEETQKDGGLTLLVILCYILFVDARGHYVMNMTTFGLIQKGERPLFT